WDGRSFTETPQSSGPCPRKTKTFLPTFITVSPQGWSSQAPGRDFANACSAFCAFFVSLAIGLFQLGAKAAPSQVILLWAFTGPVKKLREGLSRRADAAGEAVHHLGVLEAGG